MWWRARRGQLGGDVDCHVAWGGRRRRLDSCERAFYTTNVCSSADEGLDLRTPAGDHQARGAAGLSAEIEELQACVERVRCARRNPGRSASVIRAELVAIRQSCNVLEMQFARRAAELSTAVDWRWDENAIDVIRDDCKMSRHAAASAVQVGEQAPKLRESIKAVEAGEIGFSHVALMANAAQSLSKSTTASAAFDEAPLLDKARTRSVADFRNDCIHARHAADAEGVLREHRDAVEARSLHFKPHESGVVFMEATLDPVGAATVRAALEPLAQPQGPDDRRDYRQRLAGALVEIANQALDKGGLPQHPRSGPISR